MIEILTTVDFDRWLQKLRDRQARLRMLSRLDRVRFGNFGDVKNVGHGVGEMRFSSGP